MKYELLPLAWDCLPNIFAVTHRSPFTMGISTFHADDRIIYLQSAYMTFPSKGLKLKTNEGLLG